jgi:hypothetical protein
MSKLKSIQAQVQETIDKGIKTVEEQHLALASKPFDFALKIEKEAKNYSVKSMREKHDKAVDSMYESVRSINKKVNDFAADLIAKIEGEGKPAADQVAKKVRAAGKKAAKTADTVAEKVEESVS